MPYAQLKGLLTDIGTEELGHLEMIGAIVHQLTRNLTPEEIKKGGFDAYFVTHTAGVYPAAATVSQNCVAQAVTSSAVIPSVRAVLTAMSRSF